MIQQSYLSTQIPEIYLQMNGMWVSGNSNERKCKEVIRDIQMRKPCDELFHYNIGLHNLPWPVFHRGKPRPTIYYYAGMISSGTIPNENIMERYHMHIPFFLLFAEKKHIKDTLKKMLSDRYTNMALSQLRRMCTDEQFEYMKDRIYPSEPKHFGGILRSVSICVKFTPELYKYIRANRLCIEITGDYYATSIDDLRSILDDSKNCYPAGHFLHGNVVWNSYTIGGCDLWEIIDFVLGYKNCKYFYAIAGISMYKELSEYLRYLYDNVDKKNKEVVLYLLREGEYAGLDLSVLQYKDVEYAGHKIKEYLAGNTDMCDCRSRLCDLCKLRTAEHRKKIWFGRIGKDCSICVCGCIVITGEHKCEWMSCFY